MVKQIIRIYLKQKCFWCNIFFKVVGSKIRYDLLNDGLPVSMVKQSTPNFCKPSEKELDLPTVLYGINYK